MINKVSSISFLIIRICYLHLYHICFISSSFVTCDLILYWMLIFHCKYFFLIYSYCFPVRKLWIYSSVSFILSIVSCFSHVYLFLQVLDYGFERLGANLQVCCYIFLIAITKSNPISMSLLHCSSNKLIDVWLVHRYLCVPTPNS